MADHLESCDPCLQAFLRLPLPPFRVLGRPVSSFTPFEPREIEKFVTELIESCLARQATGDPLVAVADWPYESSLLRIVSLATVRLKQLGLSTAVRGAAYTSLSPPSRPMSQVDILLGAASYGALKDWARPARGRIVIHVTPWEERMSAQIYFRLPSLRRELAVAKLDPFREPIRNALLSPDLPRRCGIVACALGCDLPPGFWAGSDIPAPFVRLHDLDSNTPLAWTTVNGGQWLALYELRSRFFRNDAAFAREVLATVDYLESLGPGGCLCARRLTAIVPHKIFSPTAIDNVPQFWHNFCTPL